MFLSEKKEIVHIRYIKELVNELIIPDNLTIQVAYSMFS